MIQSVLGKIEIDNIGVTSPHEHIFIDMRHCVGITGNEPAYFFEKINLKNRGLVAADPYAILDNALLDNFDEALFEVQCFKKAGGDTIIDCTLDEIGRDPLKLKEISLKTGVNIILGCGNYYHIAHPEFVKKESVSQLAQRMYTDLTIGINGTGVKAGIIGEIGTSAVITDNEKKVLYAAGQVGKELNKSIHVHTDLYTENGFEIIDILTGEGVKPEKICIDHIDVLIRSDYIFALLDKGVFIEFDNFGKEFYLQNNKRFAYDLERIEILKKIIDAGYGDKVLLSNDICLKTMWRTYGGTGYAHILTNVRLMAEDAGIIDAYNKILTENVRTFLK